MTSQGDLSVRVEPSERRLHTQARKRVESEAGVKIDSSTEGFWGPSAKPGVAEATCALQTTLAVPSRYLSVHSTVHSGSKVVHPATDIKIVTLTYGPEICPMTKFIHLVYGLFQS